MRGLFAASVKTPPSTSAAAGCVSNSDPALSIANSSCTTSSTSTARRPTRATCPNLLRRVTDSQRRGTNNVYISVSRELQWPYNNKLGRMLPCCTHGWCRGVGGRHVDLLGCLCFNSCRLYPVSISSYKTLEALFQNLKLTVTPGSYKSLRGGLFRPVGKLAPGSSMTLSRHMCLAYSQRLNFKGHSKLLRNVATTRLGRNAQLLTSRVVELPTKGVCTFKFGGGLEAMTPDALAWRGRSSPSPIDSLSFK